MKQLYPSKSAYYFFIAFCLSILGFNSLAISQSFVADSILNRISVGIKAGANFSSMQYSDPELSEYKSSIFPRPILGLFTEIEFTRAISIRPELVYIGKGQKINDLGIKYQFSSNYFDLRLPVIYNFKTARSVQPYVLIAPTLGFAKGGKIKLEPWQKSITKASIASTDFGVMLGCGAKKTIRVSNYDLVAGVEIAYKYGFSDTYSKQENQGTANALNRLTYSIDGTRKNRGLEITASLAVPLRNFSSLFKKKTNTAVVEERKEQIPAQIKQKASIPQKDCYSIEEMLSYLNQGYNVNEKKICLYKINFETAKTTLDKVSRSYLDQIISLLQNFPSIKMKINGHTDNVGTEDYNMELSKNRALAVKNYLISNNIPESRLKIAFYGTRNPVSSNDTEDGRAQNRRVEFEILN